MSSGSHNKRKLDSSEDSDEMPFQKKVKKWLDQNLFDKETTSTSQSSLTSASVTPSETIGHVCRPRYISKHRSECTCDTYRKKTNEIQTYDTRSTEQFHGDHREPRKYMEPKCAKTIPISRDAETPQYMKTIPARCSCDECRKPVEPHTTYMQSAVRSHYGTNTRNLTATSYVAMESDFKNRGTPGTSLIANCSELPRLYIEISSSSNDTSQWSTSHSDSS
ncbi:hypothetical protein M8J77_003186 [Diaphorina citri]|nr:hypothetical protein M8J77_003186 [Diaphorina citri]